MTKNKKFKRSIKNITHSNYIRSKLPNYVFEKGPCDHKNDKGNLTFYIDYIDSRKICCSRCNKKFENIEVLKIDADFVEARKILEYIWDTPIYLPVKLDDLLFNYYTYQ